MPCSLEEAAVVHLHACMPQCCKAFMKMQQAIIGISGNGHQIGSDSHDTLMFGIC